MKRNRHNALGAPTDKRVTLDDIAKAVKVSRATVSLALNDKGTLPESRRAEIKRVAAELNYVPNPVAQALRGVRTHTIGVVTNYFSNIYFRDFYIGLEEVADAQGFSFIVSQAYESLEKEKRQVAKFSEYGVDGMLVLPCSRERDHLVAASRMGIPVVLISNTLGTDFAAVIPDNIRGTKMAVDNLLRFSARPILHIAGPQEQSSQRQRLETFMLLMRKERPDQPLENSVYKAQGLRSQAGYAAMEAIMREHTPPFSLFVCNDETTTGVLLYAAEHGLRMPEDVAVACFSGDTNFSTMKVPVSIVTTQAKRMGETTARLLLDLIERPEERIAPPQITLPVTLHDNLLG
ncbi:MAG: HTH-type transcriptional repressor PurR [Desulfovibrio sp.]